MNTGDTDQSLTPVARRLLAAVVVLVLAVAVAFLVFSPGGTDTTPGVLVDTEQVQDRIVFTHESGDTVDRQHLNVEGGHLVDGPEKFRTGAEMIVRPAVGAEEVVVTWEGEATSTMLARSEVDPLVGVELALDAGETETELLALDGGTDSLTLEPGTTVEYTVRATFESGETMDITGDAELSTSDSSVVTADRTAARADTVAPGTTELTATYRGMTDSLDLTVTSQTVWPPASTVEIPVTELGNSSEAQFTALEGLNLTDPFTLAVSVPDLAGENSTDYAVTAFYNGFNESPSDRLSRPSVPLSFDENGTATVTVGSAGTGADVTTALAPGSVADNATLVNNIEVPVGADLVAVETAN
jgi:Protein of unknown function (DUF1628)./Bacterial Ig-like domain (group 2).